MNPLSSVSAEERLSYYTPAPRESRRGFVHLKEKLTLYSCVVPTKTSHLSVRTFPPDRYTTRELNSD